MNITEINKHKLNKIIRNNDQMLFPEFLRSVRVAYGLSRKRVSEDLTISTMRLLNLESGVFFKVLDKKVLDLISDYYSIDRKIIKDKADYFVVNKLGHRPVKKEKK